MERSHVTAALLSLITLCGCYAHQERPDGPLVEMEVLGCATAIIPPGFAIGELTWDREAGILTYTVHGAPSGPSPRARLSPDGDYVVIYCEFDFAPEPECGEARSIVRFTLHDDLEGLTGTPTCYVTHGFDGEPDFNNEYGRISFQTGWSFEHRVATVEEAQLRDNGEVEFMMLVDVSASCGEVATEVFSADDGDYLLPYFRAPLVGDSACRLEHAVVHHHVFTPAIPVVSPLRVLTHEGNGPSFTLIEARGE